MELIVGGAAVLIIIAGLTAIVVLAKEVGHEKALRKEREADWELMKHVQDETNKPLPGDPADARDLLSDS